MRKKILAPLLLLALLLSLAVPAFAAGPELRLTAPETAPEAGEEFELTVELAGNSIFYTFELELRFDPSALVCTEIALSDTLEGMVSVSNLETPGTVIIGAASASGSKDNGTLATLRFRAERALSGSAFRVVNYLLGDEDGEALDLTLVGPEPFAGASGTDEPAPAEETPAPAAGFSDIAGHWGEESILRAAELGLFQGYADGSFRPNQAVTRVQFVTVLYRMAGSPEAKGELPFHDVGGLIEEFRKAIAWAYGAGCVQGKGDGWFDPMGSITRQEAMTILFKLHGGYGGLEQMFVETYDKGFADSGEIASWAKTAMYWAYYNALINGTGENALSPKGTATRAQLAKILVNYVEKFQ
ncbi:MAG: S-layer homology domain-containing protein [Oscillospiraceae bacterium]|nr:S-layer homology domain-containing protein [Oscillospiraceae bacterium]